MQRVDLGIVSVNCYTDFQIDIKGVKVGQALYSTVLIASS